MESMKSFKSIVNNTDYKLETIVTHTRNHNLKFPLRYFYIDNFLTETFWRELVDSYETIKSKMVRFKSGYDASSVTINPYLESPFLVFLSLEYKDFISKIFGCIELTNNTMLELHRHRENSENGWIHNDYDPANFKYKPIKNGLNPWYHNSPYRKILNEDESNNYIENVRSIALIYHLNEKPDWKEEHGGTTGLYKRSSDDIDNPIVSIAPIANRLVGYEVTPWSWHSFRSNNKNERVNLMHWFHSPKGLAEIKFKRAQTEVNENIKLS